MTNKAISPVVLSLALAFLVGACAPSAPAPTPTPASKPAAPAATTAPAAPTKAPAAPTAAPAAAPTKAAADGAGDFPNKPITIVIAFAAGGSSDVGARIVASIMEKDLGVPIQVVNKGGAGGQLGWTDLAKAKPDGYTIGGINLPHLPAIVVDPSRKAVFKQDDIVPLATQAIDPTQVAVRGDAPYKSMKELVEDAQKKPKQMPVGIVGILNDDEVGYLQMADAGKFEMRPVRFDGAAPAITALLGGHVDVTFCTVGDNFVQAKAGKIKPLVVMDTDRTKKFFPDVPTAKEAGYGEILSSSTRGFAAPKGVPEPIMKKLEDSLLKAMKTAEHITKIEEAGQPVVMVGRAEFTKMYNDSFETIKKWIDKAIKDS
ncbi:MAG: tripartite tricarboxylate transporter substrate binding protein [Chloroflexota bacterium]